MREIKFKVSFRNKLYKVKQISMYKDGSFCIDELWDDNGNIIYPDNDYIKAIVQFTGLTSKSGVEIYEGDIVSGMRELDRSHTSIIGNVIFRHGCFFHSGSSFGYEGEDIINLEACEVIGNIYESKDFLN